MNESLNQESVQEITFIKLKAENGKDEITFPLEDLLFFEANQNYVNIHLKTEVKKIRLKLKMVEKELTNISAISRTHRAFLVNILQVEEILSDARLVKIKLKDSDILIPVSRTYHAHFKSSLQKRETPATT
ncbi:MAG: LytTR family DNA-binding domain-containing protein [Saprospiraceae bacterium]